MLVYIKKSKKALILFFLIISFKGYSQNIISGKIFDINKRPIEFATIQNKNLNIGSVSNEKGEFQIVCSKKDTLVFRHISFQLKTIPVFNLSKNKDVTLTEKKFLLDEVVISAGNNYSVIEKIIASIEKNFESQAIFIDYQLLNEVITTDSLPISYFNGLIRLIIPSYIEKKAKLIHTKINLNNYDTIPDFLYTNPYYHNENNVAS